MSDPVGGRNPPRIGLIGHGGASGGTWSGIPSGLRRGLEAAGAEVLVVDSALPRVLRAGVAARVVAAGRPRARWERSPEAMAAGDAWTAARSVAAGWRRQDAWIQIGSESGTPRRTRLATFDDMTVAQAVDLDNRYFATVPDSYVTRWRQRQRRLYERASTCCVATHWAARSVCADYEVDPAKVAVVGMGANVETPEVPTRDWSVPRYLFIGVDWERKDGPSVLRAFEAVRAEWPAATLDVVGSHPRLDAPGVTGHGLVRLADPDGPARVAGLLRRATCFVLPSRSEPFGIAYIEAGLAGIPSVGTTVGGAAEAVGPAGLVVPPGDVTALRDAMRAFADADAAAEAGARSRAHAERFTWPLVAERVLRALAIPSPPGRTWAPLLGGSPR